MNDLEISALQQSFRIADIGQRQKTLDALVQVFRPSDFRHIDRRLHPDRFVGDMMTLLPTELIDSILRQLDPEDLFTLRNVSSIWNDCLKSSQLLETMHGQFYGSAGHYILDRDNNHVLYHNFEQKVRNRCAIKNGQISTFRLIRHAIPAHSTDTYSHGTLVQFKGNQIYVHRLDERDAGWTLLQGHDLEIFEIVTTTPEYIIAATSFRVIYCWSTSTLSLVTKFHVPGLPYDAGSTTDTLVIKCLEDWYIYHLPSKTLHHRKIVVPDGSLSPRETNCCHVESSGHAYVMELDANLAIYEFDDDASGNISLLSFTRMSDLARPLTSHLTDADLQFLDDEETEEGASTIVVVWKNKTATYLRGSNSLAAPTKILSLENGELRYRYTMENQVVRPASMIWIPELQVAYDLVTDPERGMPCGLYRVKNDAWTPVTIGKYIPDKSRTFASQKHQHYAVFGTTRDSSDERDDENVDEEKKEEEDPSWALSIDDCNAIYTGDSNYLLSIHPLLGFTRVWTFYDPDDHNDNNESNKSTP